MRKVRSLLARMGHPRTILRRKMRLAGQGDQKAFLPLLEHYLDLVCEYLYLSGYTENQELLDETSEIFLAAWECLPFTLRLSDFERILALRLTNTPTESAAPSNPLEKRLFQLKSDARFILVSYEMEGWHPFWVSLALREPKSDFSDALIGLRCRLCDMNFDLLNRRARQCLRYVAHDLDVGITIKRRAALCEEVQKLGEIKNFKGEWLAFRCELIDLRQQIRLSPEERKEFLGALEDRLLNRDRLRPQLVQRLCNHLSFDHLPDLKNGNGAYDRKDVALPLADLEA